ncbi:putative PQQ-dependent polyvinyl alcohol dehydrogenase precursor (plasmid) [Aromatoleum aromaticum EbN1]|uniref:PQQ-dependent polyvinyl alcohol dehydrogenase n=1 Tax=Aromatoleum aromaticum (strain DSM 19018 / LMG 30748 / EbN1) TaxID=76114 RepID=Q5NW84_AROAE|nr:PQQ-binding-like beta-propeller repeat protein [Aromatoleum aromaticum]CAI10680.1 putative PQQ-dependent polyvinyl alcohol dehydrogenase precursor [Aromatoleum aromaticum EbN1]
MSRGFDKNRTTGRFVGLLMWTAWTALEVQAAASLPIDRSGADFDRDRHPGKAVFAKICATCHNGGVPKAPHAEFLRAMSPAAILRALDKGVMKDQAAPLSAEERRQVAEYLTEKNLATYNPPPAAEMCAPERRGFDLSKPPAPAGWGYDNRRFVPTSASGLTKEDVPKLKLKWAYAFPDAKQARSQPVVAYGAVYVGSQDGTVYAFDLETGCAKWTSQVSGEVRTTVVAEQLPPEAAPGRLPRLFFGDYLGNVYAMDALTGKVLWRTRPDDHANATITGTPVPHDGLLYVPVSSLEVLNALDEKYACCTFRGSVTALDMNTGEIRWRHFTVEEKPAVKGKTTVGTPILGPSGAPVWNSPTIDAARGVLYFGSGENYSSPADRNSDAVFAVDLKTGERRWQFQTTSRDSWNGSCSFATGHPNCPEENGPDFDIAASVLKVEAGKGRDILVVAPKSGNVHGLSPNTGRQVWQSRVGQGSIQGGTHFGMAAEGWRVYVPVVDVMMKADGTPHDQAGAPGLNAIDARNGVTLWTHREPEELCHGRKFCEPGVSAAVTAMPGVVFAGHWNGWFRAYEGETGKILWEFDTARQFPAVNGEGVMAQGGSMSGPGATLADGHVLVNSGYGFSFKMPGNALLVFSVDGK